VTLVKGRRHSPEQIVRKLREADRFLAEGADLALVCRQLEEWRAHVRIAFLVESVSDRPDTASVRIGQAATTR
jgi:hypothetical protein